MATIRDVANAAGVSMMTASRVAREQAGVKKETREHVLRVMNQLGYEPNQVAQALRNRCSNRIGVVVSDVENSFYTLVISQIDEELKKRGFLMLLSFSNEDPTEEYDIIKTMLGSRVDGIIFTPVNPPDERVVRMIDSRKVPMLQLYRRIHHDIDSVVVDDAYGAYLATKELLESGHRDILLLDVDFDDTTLPSRTDGYIRAYREYGLDAPPDFILYCSVRHSNEQKIMRAIETKKPTGIVAGTNILGYDVVNACRKLHIAVPSEMSVIVHDDVSWVSLMDMTAISQPCEEIAKAAVKTIMNRVQLVRDQPNTLAAPPINSIVKPEINRRESILCV